MCQAIHLRVDPNFRRAISFREANSKSEKVFPFIEMVFVYEVVSIQVKGLFDNNSWIICHISI